MSMSPELAAISRQVAESLEQFQKTLISLNDAPNVQPAVPAVTQGIGDGQNDATPARRLMSAGEMFEMRRGLRAMSTPELEMMFSEQARVKSTGIPLDMWLNKSGYAAQAGFSGIHNQVDPDVSKLLDIGSSSALIRQDLEPVLYELYIRQFPAFERFRKEPANGLVHTYQQITSFGDAQFMGELGTVVDDKSTYTRQTTNVAILATRRGISLKNQFAIAAGGMSWNAEAMELQGGLRAMSHKMQKTIFGGNGTDSGGTAANELGLYDANGFTGLRHHLNTARAKNVDVLASTPELIRKGVDAAVVEIVQSGGSNPSILWGHPLEKNTFNEQQDEKTRILVPNQVNIGVGVTAAEINTISGAVPFAIVPGDSIGAYNTTNSDGAFNGGELVRDLYLLDEQTISLPFLGTDGPTVLDIPIGLSGQLTHLFIIFGMWGMAVKAPQFSNKVRVKVV